MRIISRRSVLSALGLAFPIALGTRAGAAGSPAVDESMSLRFHSFEESVRAAFADVNADSRGETGDFAAVDPCRRVEVGYSDLVRTGLQGCYNDRPFAGFPAGHLRITSTGSEPGTVVRGVRLYLTTVDIALTRGTPRSAPGRPLDFSSLPPAPTFC